MRVEKMPGLVLSGRRGVGGSGGGVRGSNRTKREDAGY